MEGDLSLMNMPSYSLHLNHRKKEPELTKGYKKSMLVDMTTYQLREICIKEKIIKGIANPLHRQELIDTILRFRGRAESLLINENIEGGFDRVSDALVRKLGAKLEDKGMIRNPAKLTMYQGLELTQYDKYKVRVSEDCQSDLSIQDIEDTNVLLIDEKNQLCGILNLTSDGETKQFLYLTKSADQKLENMNGRFYFLLFFKKEDSDCLYNIYYNIEQLPCVLDYYKLPLAEVNTKNVETTNAVLSIDFGTTNTTAGTYLNYGYITCPDENDLLNGNIQLDDVNIVHFLDDTKEKYKWLPIVPTLTSVVNCNDKEPIHYHNGYQALKDTKVKYYDESFSAFYEMKRWVETYEENQEIIDKKGNIAVVKRQDIIRQYLLSVIQNAEQRFKCRFRKLHLTSPVKLREQFNHMFTRLLPEYVIDIEDMLDEGSAVLYNTIHNMIKNKNFYNGEKLAAMIIDCGGGTTDLSSCEFRITNDISSYQIEMETTYENGDTNFGGNNITYRIMQYIKVVFANYYTGKKILSITDFINEFEMDIFRAVDKYGRDEIYETLEKAYEEAEDIIPTRFKSYENKTREEYYMVKNNFFFLFQIAEKLKKKFYEQRGVIRNCFDTDYEKENEDLIVTKVEHWNLVIRERDVLKLHHEFPKITFNIKEIELLLRADIYWIVNKFLNEFYMNRTLEDYSMIKLSGQSCRIDLFREALKEFIPGKNIEFKPLSGDQKSILDLKLACVRGSILYINAKQNGIIKVHFIGKTPNIPYSISGFTHENTEKMLIYSLDKVKTYGNLSRNKDLTQLELFLKDGEGKLKHRYLYENNREEYEPKTYEEIKEQFQQYSECIIQDETDNISDMEVKFFIFAAKEQWGFYIVPVTRENTQLYLGEEAFYSFENNVWEVNFFDGNK